MGAPEYDTLVNEMVESRKSGSAPTAAPKAETRASPEASASPVLLEKKNIILSCASVTPEEAIRKCGELMVESGYVDKAYIQGKHGAALICPDKTLCRKACPGIVYRIWILPAVWY